MEILDLVKRAIEQRMGALELLAGSVVITGGASLMPGTEQVATERFRLPVRIGKPLNVSGLVDVVASPAHATAVGLVRHGMQFKTAPVAAGSRTRQVRAVRLPNREGGAGGLAWVSNIRNFLKDFF